MYTVNKHRQGGMSYCLQMLTEVIFRCLDQYFFWSRCFHPLSASLSFIDFFIESNVKVSAFADACKSSTELKPGKWWSCVNQKYKRLWWMELDYGHLWSVHISRITSFILLFVIESKLSSTILLSNILLDTFILVDLFSYCVAALAGSGSISGLSERANCSCILLKRDIPTGEKGLWWRRGKGGGWGAALALKWL